MKARIKWVDEAMFVGESGSGHAVVMDGPADGGGRNLGPRPMEMLLLGTGACSAYDVVHILRKGRHPISDCVCELEAERAEGVPSVFTKIHMHFIVTGTGLKESVVKRAVELSAEKYCSASIMLGKSVEISHDFEICEAGVAA
ncbi:MAG: OsmC family protein [Pseudomonadota bacterium]|nr:OsmC family protein [Pseudomonadota bacterium]